jgi:hypothetical protein
MQEWTRKCERKVNKPKSGKYICEYCVKIWNNLDKRLAVACDNKIEKLKLKYM